MSKTSDGHSDSRTQAGESETLGGLLNAALNMEDQISRGVYEDYLNRRAWPAELDEETFSRIRARLTTLIEDTKKHARILRALVDEHGRSKQAR